MNERFDAAQGPLGNHTTVEPFDRRVAGLESVGEDVQAVVEVGLGEVVVDERDDGLDVLRPGVDHRVWSGVVGVGCDVALASGDGGAVELADEGHDGSGHVVHVEDGRLGVEAAGVELVRVLHGDLSESVKVFGADGFRDSLHALRHDMLDAMLQQGRGLNGALHACCRRRSFFEVGHDANESLQVGPVRLRGDLHSIRVLAVGLLPHLPRDKATKDGSAGGP